MMHIPLGHSHEAVVEGKCEKRATCEYCRRDFVYVLSRQGVGRAFNLLDVRSDRAMSAAATERAERHLACALQEHNLVACPSCGWYQAAMVRQFKQRRFRAMMHVGTTLAIIPIVFFSCIFPINPWLLTVTLSILALSSFGWGGWLLIWNPNAGLAAGEQQKRAAGSEGTLVDELRVSGQADAVRDSGVINTAVTQSTGDPFDFLATAPRPARREYSKAKAEKERKYRPPLIGILMVSGAAALGALFDAFAFGAPQGQISERIVGALFVGPLFGMIAHLFASPYVETRLVPQRVLTDAKTASLTGSLCLDAQSLASATAVITAAGSAAAFASGVNPASIRGLVLSLGCQAATMLTLHILRHGKPNGSPGN